MINIKQWLRSITGVGDKTINIMCKEIQGIALDTSMRKIAFWSVVNRIANIISKCEFCTYSSHKKIFSDEYYSWNFSPNKNQSSDIFLKEMISKLYSNNETLVIEKGGELYVADDFKKESKGTKEYIFYDIKIEEQIITRKYRSEDVLYFKLNDENVKGILDALYENYKKLIDLSINAYRKTKGSKGTLSIDTIASGDPNFQENLKKLLEEDFQKFFNSDNAVLPLFKGYEYKQLDSKTYSADNTRDIKSQFDDIFDFTARGFCFPPSLAKGDVQDTQKAIDEMLTFCIDPLVDMIQTEINRKKYGKKVLDGDYLKIDTTSIKHIDIIDVATSVDKLIGSGVTSVNDILKLMGMPKIDEGWANAHYLTKNYSTFEELLKNAKGGE